MPVQAETAIDLAMPLLDGLEATRQVLEAMPMMRVLSASAHAAQAPVALPDHAVKT